MASSDPTDLLNNLLQNVEINPDWDWEEFREDMEGLMEAEESSSNSENSKFSTFSIAFQNVPHWSFSN